MIRRPPRSTLSLHDALPISTHQRILDSAEALFMARGYSAVRLRDIADEIGVKHAALRSEEHTSELQSRQYLVCRLLLDERSQPSEAGHRRSMSRSVPPRTTH